MADLMNVAYEAIVEQLNAQIQRAREEERSKKMKQARKQRDKSRSRMNFVSQREFKYYGGADFQGDLIRNYASRIANRVHTDANMRDLAQGVFGNRWWEQSYSKLYKLAQMASESRHCESPYWGMEMQQYNWVKLVNSGRRRYQALHDSSVYRICKRFYKVSVLNEWLDENTNLYGSKGYYSCTENMLTNLARVAVAVRKYDKEDLALLKKIDKPNVLTKLCGSTSNFCNCGDSWMGGVVRNTMTESQGAKLLHDSAHAWLTRELSDNTDKVAWATVKLEFIERMVRKYSDTNSWHTPTNRAIKAASRAKTECDKIFDAERIAEKLGLSITGGDHNNIPYISWRTSRINGNTYKLLKELEKAYDAGAELDIVQDIAKKRSTSIHQEMYWKASLYTPMFV